MVPLDQTFQVTKPFCLNRIQSKHLDTKKIAKTHWFIINRVLHSSHLLTRERFRDSSSVFFPRNHSTRSDQFPPKWQLQPHLLTFFSLTYIQIQFYIDFHQLFPIRVATSCQKTMFKLSVYLFHHTSFFAVCSTNSVTLGRKSVARKKKIDSGKTRLLCSVKTYFQILMPMLIEVSLNLLVKC